MKYSEEWHTKNSRRGRGGERSERERGGQEGDRRRGDEREVDKRETREEGMSERRRGV